MRLSSFSLALAIMLATFMPASAEWLIETVATPNKIRSVRQAGDEIFVQTDTAWFQISQEDNQTQFNRSLPPREINAPGGPPDSYVKEYSGFRAWYAQPTSRYPHGALGDRVEGGSLVVETGQIQVELVLPDHQVFEDIAPRIVDLTDDGVPEFITIRAGIRSGAAVVAYEIDNGALKELAASKPIGTPNRWLNIAGIEDFDGDGQKEIAIVVKPHIQGTLQLLELKQQVLRSGYELSGFSNHIYGDPELALSAVSDVDGDRIVDLVLPSFDRRALVSISFKGAPMPQFSVEVPRKIKTAIGSRNFARKPEFFFADDQGKLYVVRKE